MTRKELEANVLVSWEPGETLGRGAQATKRPSDEETK